MALEAGNNLPGLSFLFGPRGVTPRERLEEAAEYARMADTVKGRFVNGL